MRSSFTRVCPACSARSTLDNASTPAIATVNKLAFGTARTAPAPVKTVYDAVWLAAMLGRQPVPVGSSQDPVVSGRISAGVTVDAVIDAAANALEEDAWFSTEVQPQRLCLTPTRSRVDEAVSRNCAPPRNNAK
jgi:hypothetical protein